MNSNKKELAVAALRNGTVIDHIPTDVLFKVVDLLGLDKLDVGITIGNNLESRGMGKKGIIKISDVYFPENILNRIAVIAPTAKINVIRNYEITEKYDVVLPDSLTDVLCCNNPKCITNNEPMKTRFEVLRNPALEFKCCYCGRTMKQSEIDLKLPAL